MPTFATPGPITATVQVAGAQVRATASHRTEPQVYAFHAGRVDPDLERRTRLGQARELAR